MIVTLWSTSIYTGAGYINKPFFSQANSTDANLHLLPLLHCPFSSSEACKQLQMVSKRHCSSVLIVYLWQHSIMSQPSASSFLVLAFRMFASFFIRWQRKHDNMISTMSRYEFSNMCRRIAQVVQCLATNPEVFFFCF